jgi:hypothetical protein
MLPSTSNCAIQTQCLTPYLPHPLVSHLQLHLHPHFPPHAVYAEGTPDNGGDGEATAQGHTHVAEEVEGEGEEGGAQSSHNMDLDPPDQRC